MSEYMAITIQMEPYEMEYACHIIKKIKEADKNSEDSIILEPSEKQLVLSVFNKLIDSGRRKAEKLEMLGNEFKNIISFGTHC